MSISERIQHDILHRLVHLILRLYRIPLEIVTEKFVKVCRQIGNELEWKARSAEVHVSHNEIPEEGEEWVGAEGIRAV